MAAACTGGSGAIATFFLTQSAYVSSFAASGLFSLLSSTCLPGASVIVSTAPSVTSLRSAVSLWHSSQNSSIMLVADITADSKLSVASSMVTLACPSVVSSDFSTRSDIIPISCFCCASSIRKASTQKASIVGLGNFVICESCSVIVLNVSRLVPAPLKT